MLSKVKTPELELLLKVQAHLKAVECTDKAEDNPVFPRIFFVIASWLRKKLKVKQTRRKFPRALVLPACLSADQANTSVLL